MVASLAMVFNVILKVDVALVPVIRFVEKVFVFAGQSLKLNPQAPVAQKMRMRWFFDVSKVKESSFFKSDLTDPP